VLIIVPPLGSGAVPGAMNPDIHQGVSHRYKRYCLSGEIIPHLILSLKRRGKEWEIRLHSTIDYVKENLHR
jgi:hypothetical protein